mgnify:CR=1 FL=1|jgi:hypothetical protein
MQKKETDIRLLFAEKPCLFLFLAVTFLQPTAVCPPVYSCGLLGTQLSPREPTVVNRSFALCILIFFQENRDKNIRVIIEIPSNAHRTGLETYRSGIYVASGNTIIGMRMIALPGLE